MLAAGVTAAITAAPAAIIITAPHRDTPNCIIRVSLVSYFFVCECGGMVDALSSGGSECMLVGVQLPPLARMEKTPENVGTPTLRGFLIYAGYRKMCHKNGLSLGYWPKCVSGGMGLVGGVGVSYAGVEFVPVDAGAVPVGDAAGFVCALWTVFPCFAAEFLDLLVTDGVGHEP